ncbi:hypothetical protein ACOSQ3_012894 [Xanthoceras sorbifolium]
MTNEEVHVIIGPQRSAQAKFVVSLGEKSEVPIISFSATSPGLSPTENPFFIRTAHDDSFQVRAIADTVKAYGWREVIPIYENTDYGNGLITYLNDAFQEHNIRVPYRSVISLNSSEGEILQELKKLKQNRTTIFVVHMTAFLGSKLFTQANKAGMMSEGYAWIVTEGLSTLIDPIDPKVMDHSMQGVLGVRPYIPMSKKIKNFKAKSKGSINGLNLFGLWAYNTFWAVAMAVEKAAAGIANSSFSKPNTSKLLVSLGKSEMAFEIFNVIGETERIIGYWTREKGLIPDLLLNNNGVQGFPLPHEFVPYGENGKMAGRFDELLHQITEQKLNAVVRDITIVANHSKFVDFTLPYFESRVSMVVLVKNDERKDFWILLKPFSWDLWLTTGLAFIFLGLVLWVLEHHINIDFKGPHDYQVGTIFWFFSTLVFAHSKFQNTFFLYKLINRVVNNWSRFVLIIWVFVVLILTQSYTASLTSMLTVQRLQPRFADLKEIRDQGHFIGYQKHSFVKELLTKQLNFDDRKHRRGVSSRIAFPKGSPLVSYISRAILNVTETGYFSKIENKIMGGKANCEGQAATLSSDSLSVYSFAGLSIITGAASMSSLLIYTFNFIRLQWPLLNDIHPEGSRSFWSKIIYLIKNFDEKNLSAHPFRRCESRVHPAPPNPEGIETSPDINNCRTIQRLPMKKQRMLIEMKIKM